MPGFTEFTLQHPRHASSVLQGLNSLRNWGHLFCDCTLLVEDEEFPIHKSVLAASSQYFRALFTTDMQERGRSRIALCGISAATFQFVLDYAYTGAITLNQATVTHVYVAADMFQLEDLKDLCHDFLLNQLAATNCIGIWRLAGTLNNTTLEDTARRYVIAHFTNAKDSREFLCLNWDEVKFILSSYQQQTDYSRSNAHTALCKWLRHNIKERGGDDLFNVTGCEKVRKDGTCISLPGKGPIEILKHIADATKLAAIPDSLLSRTSLVTVGGYHEGMEKTCEQYCENDDSWQLTTWDLSGSCECFHWVGVIGLRLYAVGGDGLTTINRVVSRLTEEAAKQLRTNALETGWEHEVTLAHDCSDMKFCIMDDCIYGCGGCGSTSTSIYRYNPGIGSWESVCELLTEPRVLFQFFSHEHTLHLIGGMLPATSNFTAINSYEVYDPGSNTWDRQGNMAVGRYSFGVGVIDDCLYVVGGFGSGEIMLNSVEVYCFGTKTWSLASVLPAPKASMACQSWRGKLYCLGGEDTGTSADALVMEPLSGEWTTITPLNHPRIYPNTIELLQ